MSTQPAALEDLRMPGLELALLQARTGLLSARRCWPFSNRSTHAGRTERSANPDESAPLHWGMNG